MSQNNQERQPARLSDLEPQGASFNISSYIGIGKVAKVNADLKDPAQSGQVETQEDVINHLFTLASVSTEDILGAGIKAGLPFTRDMSFEEIESVFRSIAGVSFRLLGSSTNMRYKAFRLQHAGDATGGTDGIVATLAAAKSSCIKPPSNVLRGMSAALITRT